MHCAGREDVHCADREDVNCADSHSHSHSLSLSLSHSHTSIHEGIHTGGRAPKARAPLCGGGAKRRLLHGWVCGCLHNAHLPCLHNAHLPCLHNAHLPCLHNSGIPRALRQDTLPGRNWPQTAQNGKLGFSKKMRFDCENSMFLPDFDEKVKMR